MMFCQKFAVTVALLLAAETAALVCPHMTLEFRDGQVYKDDAGLVACSNSSTHCMYHASTTFYTNGTSLPSHFEGVHCSEGGYLNPNNQSSELSTVELASINFCDSKIKGQIHALNTTVDGSSVQLVHRVNDARCCSTDNCTIEEYKKIGGGLARDSLTEAIYKKVTNLFYKLKNKLFW